MVHTYITRIRRNRGELAINPEGVESVKVWKLPEVASTFSSEYIGEYQACDLDRITLSKGSYFVELHLG